MSNKELIERLRGPADFGTCLEAADALEAADKRIAELEELLRAEPFRSEREKESERKLEVAMDALKVSAIMPRSHEAHRRAVQALAQIGGEDAR